VADTYSLEVLEHKVHQRGNIQLQVLVGRSVVQKLVDGVGRVVVWEYMTVDAADMDRIAEVEVGKVEFVDTMGYNLDYLV
jgi:hypothetical protein